MAQTSSGADNQYLNGQYAFLLKGVTMKTSANQPVLTDLIGAFVADGKGNITKGVATINSAAKFAKNMPIYGSYTVNADGTGTIGLNTPLGSTSYAISVIAGPTSTIQAGEVTSLANPTGAGSFHLQNPATFSSTTSVPEQQAQFLVELSGEMGCTGACLTSGTGPAYISAQGLATIQLSQSTANSGGTITLPVIATAGTQYTMASLSGTLSQAGVYGGRLLTIPGGSSVGLSQFAVYQYGLDSFYMMSLDPHSSAPLLSGNAQQAR